MNVWIALIGGIMLGWLIEWVIDWVYWRRGAEAFYIAERDLRLELHGARQELVEAQATIERLQEQLASGPKSLGRVEKSSQLTGAGGEQLGS